MLSSSVKNKRLRETKLALIWEISLANQNNYANTIGPLETFSIVLILHLCLILSVLYSTTILLGKFSAQKNS